MCSRGLRSLLAVTANDVVTQMNPLQTAIASDSAVLKIHLVYLCKEDLRGQVILDVRLILGLLELLV